MSSTQQQTLQRWIVKSVLSGDTIVVRGQPKGGPPPERTICLSNTTAPRIARRANPNVEGSTETKDEPYGWEAREFLRKKLTGREVAVSVEYKAPGTGREYGVVYLGKDASGENMTETMLAEGLLELRRMGLKADDPQNQKLIQIEEQAKAAGKGKWASDAASHVRSVSWTIENPRHYVDALHGKPVNAVIEHVRDGCTVRAFILPNFDYLTVMLSGIKCPMFKLDEATGKQVPEPYAEEAKFFTESRLLQRDVQIILEGVSNQNFLGTILHPNGNITELLLKEGFARCVDWSMGVVSQGAEKLRAAEKTAKEKQVRLWKDYKPSGPAIDTKDKSFSGKVVEVVNGDALVVKLGDNSFKKIFLASIRPPRQSAEANENAPPAKDNKQRSRPLYDIPYMLEAREFLRKKLIGKKIGVEIDYIQPANQGYPERTCCTITIGGINVAEALVSKGLATVIRYRMDDDQRSSQYDILLGAEERAKKKAVGMHSKKEPPIHRVADITGDVAKAKQFLPFLQRAGKSEAVVEFVASGSRLRLFIPRETCLITFLISGIDCPKAARTLPSGHMPGDPFGEEAMLFTKELCLQREVEVEVETIDKGGNFIGWLYVDGINLSVALVEAGLAKMHFTAERSNHHKTLQTAEAKAKEEKLNIWSTHEEPQTVEVREEPTERKVNYKNVIATEVTDQLHFYVQFVEQGPKLEELMEKLTKEMEANPPLAGAHTPKKGELLAAQFSVDNLWYRARVERISGANVSVLFVDYGNRETMPSTKTATLPSQFHMLPPQASEYALACITVPEDDDQRQEAVDVLYHDIMNKQLKLNVEYRGATVDHVTLQYQDSSEDVGRALVAEGLVQVDVRKEKRLASLVADYVSAQETAKNERRNIWRYGDFTEDDAREFGFKK